MIHRLVVITTIQIVLYAVGIPMLVAYQVACTRPGSSCGAPASARSTPSALAGVATAELPR